jgi:hypothetical protein
MKQCSVCNEEKALDEFPKRIAVANGLQGRCKACEKIYKAKLYLRNHAENKRKHKANYQKNIERYRELSRQHYRRTAKVSNVKRRCKKRGITVEQYEQMLIDQNHSCATCEKWLHEHERSIDHCHETNIVRGILCDNCNTAIGLMKDSIKICESIIAYLRKYKK